MPELYTFELCEQFAAIHGIPVDYVWQEFVDPTISTEDEIVNILGAFLP